MDKIVLKIANSPLRINEDNLSLFLIKPLFLLLVYFGVYNRRAGLLGFNGGETAVILSFGLFFLCLIHVLFFRKSIKLTNFSALIGVFFILSIIIPFLSTFIFGSENIRILRYSLEVVANFFMFFSTYYFVRERLITPKFFIYSIAFLGVFSSLGYLKGLIGSISIYRISGLTGTNTLGNSYALGTFSWLLILYTNSQKKLSKIKNYGSYFCILILLLGMFFTGTRAAIIALIVGVAMFQILGMKSKSFTKYLLIFLAGITVLIAIIAYNIDLSNLLGRFSTENIVGMALIRFNIYASSITDLTFLDFLFGRPEYYIFSNNADNYINPHNLFLATIRYNGIIPFIILICIFIGLFYKYLLLYKIHYKHNYYRVVESSIIIFFIIVVIYTMFSGGRTTRSFNFFITLGYAVGYFEIFKNIRSYKDYEKIIV